MGPKQIPEELHVFISQSDRKLGELTDCNTTLFSVILLIFWPIEYRAFYSIKSQV